MIPVRIPLIWCQNSLIVVKRQDKSSSRFQLNIQTICANHAVVLHRYVGKNSLKNLPMAFAFTLRDAKEEDVETILRFILAPSTNQKLVENPSTNGDLLRQYLFPTSGFPTAKVLMIMNENTSIAMALYFYNYSTFTGFPGIYLTDIFILPEYKGKGVGSFIFTNIAKIAVKEECTRLFKIDL